MQGPTPALSKGPLYPGHQSSGAEVMEAVNQSKHATSLLSFALLCLGWGTYHEVLKYSPLSFSKGFIADCSLQATWTKVFCRAWGKDLNSMFPSGEPVSPAPSVTMAPLRPDVTAGILFTHPWHASGSAGVSLYPREESPHVLLFPLEPFGIPRKFWNKLPKFLEKFCWDFNCGYVESIHQLGKVSVFKTLSLLSKTMVYFSICLGFLVGLSKIF